MIDLMTMDLKVLQMISSHLTVNTSTLEYFLNHENTDIACLAKTFSENDLNGTNKLLNFNIVQKIRIRYDVNNDIVIIKTVYLPQSMSFEVFSK